MKAWTLGDFRNSSKDTQHHGVDASLAFPKGSCFKGLVPKVNGIEMVEIQFHVGI